MCSHQLGKFILYMKTLGNYCAPNHKLWKMFLCLGQEERHSKMKVIISLGICYNGAVPSSHFSTVVWGISVLWACIQKLKPIPVADVQQQPLPPSHKAHSPDHCCLGQSCTTPSSWEGTVTGPETKAEIKVRANTAFTGTWNAALIVALCVSTSWWQLFELWRSQTLTNI